MGGGAEGSEAFQKFLGTLCAPTNMDFGETHVFGDNHVLGVARGLSTGRYHGVRKVYHVVGKVYHGGRKVYHGGRKVYHGGMKVYHVVRKVCPGV